jgi:TolB-like protein/Tfp pilus assembly protein PilF
LSLLTELKRRNVIRMAGLYLVGAWLLVQVASTVLPMFGAPTWLPRTIVLLLAIGFVPALVFAWIFELTPQGLRRDEDVPARESIAPRTARRMDRMIIVVLALALLYFGVDKFVLAPQREAAHSTQAAAPTPTDGQAQVAKSIAVLPFENLSSDKDNAYFATGMQDEILTRLAGIHDLKVISRTSTEQYASRPPNLKIVGEQLGVATLLEGSVQKANGKVRINLQLIDAASDSHLWAENYDRDLKDVFAVQSDVAEKVADALKAQLLPAESVRIARIPTQDQAAYDLYLKGRYLFSQLQTSSAKDPVAVGRQATDLYSRAVAADPKFALAYAWQSYLQSYLHWYGVDSSPGVVELAESAARNAMALQPDLPEAHLAIGYVHYWCHRDYAAALDEFAIAHAGLPNNAEVVAAIGYVHRRQGDDNRGISEMEQASVLDPRNSVLPREIANSYVAMRRYADADAAYARSLAIFPGDIEAQVQRATSAMFSGNFAAAKTIIDGIPPAMDPQATVSMLRFRLAMIQRNPDAALAAIANAPPWLMTRWEHSVAPVGLLRGQALQAKGDSDGARSAFQQAEQALQGQLANAGTAIDASSYLGLVKAGLGEKEAALSAARSAVERMPIARDVISGTFQLERLARVEAQVGETSAAIGHLRQLMESAGGETLSVATLRIDPAWDPLRRDPGFQRLVADSEAAQARTQTRH